MIPLLKRAASALLCTFIGGCGFRAPPVSYTFGNDDQAGVFVLQVSSYLRCEMERAVQTIAYYNPETVDWLRYWSAEVTLTIYLTEKTYITPGVVVNKLLPSATTRFGNGSSVTSQQQFNIGLGGTYNNTAVRNISPTWFILFNEFFPPKGKPLVRPSSIDHCDHHDGVGLESDLKLYETLVMGLQPAKIGPGFSNPFKTGGPLQNIQYRISFDVEAGASVTPSWRLVDVAANTSGTFISSDRDRKDEFLITMGPAQLSADAKGRALVPSALAPSANVGEVHNIGRINSLLSR